MLKTPDYLKEAGIQNGAIAYTWHPNQDVELAEKYPKNVETIIKGISLRATLTIGIGVGEWLVWRLDARSNYPQVEKYTNALWARTIHPLYLKFDTLDQPKDEGSPILGPLLGLEHQLSGMLTWTTLDDPQRGRSIAQLVALVRYTLTDPSAFDVWLGSALDRFTKHFPLETQNRGGQIVPRKFLDPKIKIEVEMSQVATILDEQIRSIQYAGNPFLATPAEMKEEGFEGTPYRYQP